MAWAVALVFGPIFALGGPFFGYPMSIIGFVIAVAFPYMTKKSFEANNEAFRYYTWIYRTTKPVMGRIKVITSQTEAGKVQTAKVWIGETEFQCDVIPNTNSPQTFDEMDDDSEIREMPIFVIPESGEPLCAEFNQMRVWLEPSLLRLRAPH